MPSTLTRPLALLGLLFALTAVLAARPAQAGAAAPEYRGVQLHSLWEETSTAAMHRDLDLADQTGANVIRVDVGWSSLETGGKGQFSDWYVNKLDDLVNTANAKGMKVIAGLWSTPCWASSAPETKKQGCAGSWWDRGVTMYAPSNNQDFADISRWITSRYGTKLAALEVWNEPNLSEDRFWIASNEAASYAGMLKAAYPAAKAGNSQVPVLAGSLAVGGESFVNSIYAHGIKGSYDGLSVHPYNQTNPENGRWGGLDWMRNLQRANGDGKPLWLTEFGFTSCSGGSWCVSEAEQAENLKGSFRALEREPNIKAAVVYNLREKGNSGSFEDNFGLVSRHFTPKPGYYALREALGGSGQAAPARKRLRLRLVRRRKAVVAILKGPKRARVALKVTRCPKASRKRFKVRTSRTRARPGAAGVAPRSAGLPSQGSAGRQARCEGRRRPGPLGLTLSAGGIPADR